LVKHWSNIMMVVVSQDAFLSFLPGWLGNLAPRVTATSTDTDAHPSWSTLVKLWSGHD
jgi:hypothetical protein